MDNKKVDLFTMEFYSASKNETMELVEKFMDLKSFIQGNPVNKKQKMCILSLMEILNFNICINIDK